MPQLPTDEQLGVVGAQPAERGVSVPFAGAVGEAQRNFGAAVTDLGGTVVDVHDEEALAKAEGTVWQAKAALDEKYKNDPDPATMAQRYQKEAQGIVDNAGGDIINPRAKLQFQEQFARRALAMGTEAIQNRADAQIKANGAASTLTSLDNLNMQAARTDNPAEAMAIHGSMARQLAVGVKLGYFSPEWAAQHSQTLDNSFAENWAANQDPKELADLYKDGDYGKKTGTPLDLLMPGRIKEIAQASSKQAVAQTAPGFVHQFLDGGAGAPAGAGGDYASRVAQIESNNGAASSNIYQFKGATAAQYGVTDQSTPEQQTEALKRLTADNAAALKSSLGREASAPELYLAHQQGAGGAAALIQNPNQRAIDVLEPFYADKKSDPDGSIGARAAVLNNGGTVDMTAGQFAQMWEGKFAGQPGVGAAPSLAQSAASRTVQYGQNWPSLDETLTAIDAQYPDNPQANAAARREALTMYHERDAALKEAETGLKTLQTDYTQRMLAHYYDPTQPAVDLREVAKDFSGHQDLINQLTEYQRTLDNQANKPGGGNEASNVLDMYRRINLPAGDPNRLTSTDPILQGAIDGKYSPEKADYLVKQFNEIKNPQGESLNKVQGDFLSAKEAAFKALDQGTGLGAEQALSYNQWVAQQVADYRKAGKDPFDLFNPTNKAYLGSASAMSMFQQTMAARMAAETAANPPAPGLFQRIGNALGIGDNSPVGGYDSLDTLKAALGKGDVTRAWAESYARGKGWIQ